MNTDLIKVGLNYSYFATNPTLSGETFHLKTLIISNLLNSDVEFSLELVRGESIYKIIDSGLLASKSLLPISNDQGLFLEQGDSLRIKSSEPDSLNVVCSYERQEQTTPTISLNFQDSPFSALSIDEDIDYIIAPSDLVFEITNEKYGNENVQGIIKNIEYFSENIFVINLNPFYLPTSEKVVQFQIRLNDPRFAEINKSIVLSKNKNYDLNLKLNFRIKDDYSGDLTEQTIDYIYNWMVEYWNLYESEGDYQSHRASFSAPQSVGGYFNPFAPAVWYIYDNNNLTTNLVSDVETYIENNLQEFKSYTLDKNLIRSFFNNGVPEVVDLDALYILATSNNNIISGSNPFGVTTGTYKCMMDSGLYCEPTIKPCNPPADREHCFDCRSFTEAALIFLKNQLKDVCPNASVHVLDIPSHSLVFVDLGGDPKPCCEGSFVYEPQSGQTWSDYKEYCSDKSVNPCIGTIKPPGWGWDDTPQGNNFTGCPSNQTHWQDDPAQVQRIGSIICDCVSKSGASSIPGTTENYLSGICPSGINDWVKNTFGYDNGDPNGPGNNSPDLPGVPQIVGCERYRCNMQSGCVESDDGNYSKYECDTLCLEKYRCKTVQSSPCKQCVKLWTTGFISCYTNEEECKENCGCSSSSSSSYLSSSSSSSDSSSSGEKIGAWCFQSTCDGQIYQYAVGCGTFQDWLNASSDKESFQEGKTCQDNNCEVKKCSSSCSFGSSFKLCKQECVEDCQGSVDWNEKECRCCPPETPYYCESSGQCVSTECPKGIDFNIELCKCCYSSFPNYCFGTGECISCDTSKDQSFNASSCKCDCNRTEDYCVAQSYPSYYVFKEFYCDCIDYRCEALNTFEFSNYYDAIKQNCSTNAEPANVGPGGICDCACEDSNGNKYPEHIWMNCGGACCYGDNECKLVTSNQSCDSLGGKFHPGKPCSDDPCGYSSSSSSPEESSSSSSLEIHGACCFGPPDYDCISSVTKSFCDSKTGGVFQGGVNCVYDKVFGVYTNCQRISSSSSEPLGACCYTDPTGTYCYDDAPKLGCEIYETASWYLNTKCSQINCGSSSSELSSSSSPYQQIPFRNVFEIVGWD